MTETATEKRKPRIQGLSKQVRKLRLVAFQFAPTIFRYAVIPAMLFTSIYYTEPETTLFELLNPFF